MHGKKGEDVIIEVPPGTIIRDSETNRIIADLTEPDQRVVLARGGRGGRVMPGLLPLPVKPQDLQERV